jgi:SPP1 gp7 family putative phage head morphogenesis protein
MSAEREYRKFLRRYAESYIKLMRQGLDEIVPDLKEIAGNEQPRMDVNIADKIERLMKFVQGKLDMEYPESILARWALQMIGKVNDSSKKTLNKQFKIAYKRIGEEPPNFEPLMRDGKLTPFYQNVVDENVSLIRSIPKLKLDAFKNQLVALVTADSPSLEIKKAILKNFDITRGRAELIARDQVGKLNGYLEEYRQKQLGLTRYVWRTSEDSRVRKDHKALDGKVFTWAKPPIVDKRTGRRAHPKRDFQCRCWAEPILEDVIEA